MNTHSNTGITILGAGGMLGSSLQRQAGLRGLPLRAFTRQEVDICDESGVSRNLPEQGIVVNCAAWTDVDGAEGDEQGAYRVNAIAPGKLASRCAAAGLSFVHVSTDYVFDGRAARPYVEKDSCSPLNAYGRSKLAGEQAVQDTCPDALIVRTQGLYGRNGRNFVDTILGRLVEGQSVQVVNDQFVAPVSTDDLAEAILNAVHVHAEGLLHIGATGCGSWYDVACEIARLRGYEDRVSATDSSAYERPAQRPEKALLDCSRYSHLTGIALPDWKDSLGRYLCDSEAGDLLGQHPSNGVDNPQPDLKGEPKS